jgi:hypothetical protein
MKLAPQMKRMNCVLILGVYWPVLKETRNKILGRLSIRDNGFPACGKFRNGLESCELGHAISW